MNKKWIVRIGAGTVIVGLSIAGASFAKSNKHEVQDGTIRLEHRTEADFPALSKITFVQAVQRALDAAKGDTLKIELENENGFLVYSVEIVTADRSIMDVKVDAGSGKVLAIERDRNDDEDRDSDEHDADRDDDD